jgi:anthranilate/para-aminobenzoate synthase component II
MNSDRRTILALIAMGRITPGQAERLLAAVNESRETAWILAICLAVACMAQLQLHGLLPALMHFFHLQVPALAEAVHHAVSPIRKPITEWMPLTRMGGLL